MAEKLIDLKLNYDTESDVLYCTVGEPREAIGVETEGGVILRLDPASEEVVGFTIVDFFQRFKEHPNETFSVRAAASACAHF
jgi:uncharacterized protein YuzE